MLIFIYIHIYIYIYVAYATLVLNSTVERIVNAICFATQKFLMFWNVGVPYVPKHQEFLIFDADRSHHDLFDGE